ncbi:MAG TPA: response regulator [Ktedonobacteraceae bacterium]|nr:response regulator [Ktedonobacteraceae bacterium]
MSNENNQYLENLTKPMKTILLVEDDSIISELLIQMIIQETPYKVCSAPDALAALELVKNIKPQLLILDYWLPLIQGIELYDRLHNTEGLEEVPAIMLSVNAPLREINQRDLTYIRKPFDMPKLLDTIHRLIV